jgi:hypothetical protein
MPSACLSERTNSSKSTPTTGVFGQLNKLLCSQKQRQMMLYANSSSWMHPTWAVRGFKISRLETENYSTRWLQPIRMTNFN